MIELRKTGRYPHYHTKGDLTRNVVGFMCIGTLSLIPLAVAIGTYVRWGGIEVKVKDSTGYIGTVSPYGWCLTADIAVFVVYGLALFVLAVIAINEY